MDDLLLIGGAAALLFIIGGKQQDAGRIGSVKGDADVVDDAIASIANGPLQGRYDSQAAKQADIIYRAVKEDWSASQTMDILSASSEGTYQDPKWAQQLAPIPSSTSAPALLAQYNALINRGGTYDMVNASALLDFINGVVGSIWVSQRGGTSPLQEYTTWKSSHLR